MDKRHSEKYLRSRLLADFHRSSEWIASPPSVSADAIWRVVARNGRCVAQCFGMGELANDDDGGEGLAVRAAAALNYCRNIPTEHLLTHAAGVALGPVGREVW